MSHFVLGAGRRSHAFYRQGITFDGDYFGRGDDLDGNSDAKSAIGSFWIMFNGSDGTQQEIYATDAASAGNYIRKSATNKIVVVFKDGGGNNDLVIQSNTAYTADSTWHHVLWAFDVATGTTQMYIDGSDDEAAGSTAVNDTLDFATASHVIGGETDGSDLVDADIAEFWMDFGETLDISSATNRAKFRDANGRPVNLGDDGSFPLGSQPIVYFSSLPGAAAANFAINLGSGGNPVAGSWNLTGALAVSSTSPCD